jgi:hypothetical protein
MMLTKTTLFADPYAIQCAPSAYLVVDKVSWELNFLANVEEEFESISIAEILKNN